MKAAVFNNSSEPIELIEFPTPIPEANEAVVNLELCTVCGSDLHTISGKRIEPTPTILGHEILGVVSTIGSPAPKTISGTSLKVGDRVTWSTCISCGECNRCKSGLSQKCLSVEKYGHNVAIGRNALRGGFSEKILLSKGTSIVKVSSEVPAETIAPVNCATATVAAAFRVAQEISEKRILIIGAGLLGLTAAAFATMYNPTSITVCDINPQRLELAKEFGATQTIQLDPKLDDESSPLGSGRTYDVILDFAGSSATLEDAIALADVSAKVVLVGSVMKSPPIKVDPERMVRNWVSIHGVHNYTPGDLAGAVEFLEKHGDRFPFFAMVGKKFPLDEIQQAIDFALQTKPIRIGITQ